jgi:peptidyl-prolyl cis-trans isomerase D
MLQSLRDKTPKWIVTLVFGLLALPFAMFGVNSYMDRGANAALATVGDKEITLSEFNLAMNQQISQYSRQFGDQFDASILQSPESKRRILDGLIDRKLVEIDAEKNGVTASPEQVQESIAQIPNFQVAGKFNGETFKMLLASQNPPISPEKFFDDQKTDLIRAQIAKALEATSVVTDFDIDQHVRLRDQTRSFKYVSLMAADLPLPAAPADADLKRYFDTQTGKYMNPEAVDLEYVQINLVDIAQPAAPTEQEIKKAYEATKATKYVQAEQRLASHILINVPENAKPEQLKVAQAKAQQLSDRARAGENFAELAKANSEDLGSKDEGGDLGYLEKNGATEPAFESALFALKTAGDVSGPVLTKAGYHVISLREIKPEHGKSFDEVRGEIAAEIATNARQGLFNDKLSKLGDLTTKNSQSLLPASKELGLSIQRTGMITRNGGPGIASNQDVLKNAFSDFVLNKGLSSNLISLSKESSVVVRVAQHRKEERKPLADVKAQVIADWQNEQRSKALKDKGIALNARLLKGESIETIATELGKTVQSADAVVRTAATVPADLLGKVFKLARPSAKATTANVDVSPAEIALVSLSAVTDGDAKKLDKAARDALRTELQSMVSAAEFQSYLAALRASTSIKIHQEQLQQN